MMNFVQEQQVVVDCVCVCAFRLVQRHDTNNSESLGQRT